MPKVTIVIPCYNHGLYVGRAVESAVKQTFQDIEVLVVDDGSNEARTIDILEKLSAPKTRVLRKANGHLSSARNFGIAQSESPYVLTLDADDHLFPRYLERSLPVLEENPDVAIVTCQARTFGLPPEKIIPNKGGDVTNFVVNNGCQASCLIRRKCWEAVGGYNETMKAGYEDWDFHLAITAQGWRIASVPEILFNYRVSPDSMVVGADRRRDELVRRLIRNHREAFEKNVEDAVVQRERRIMELQSEVDSLRGSLSYRVGRCFTQPKSILKSALARLWARMD